MNKKRIVRKCISISMDGGESFKIIAVSDLKYTNKEEKTSTMTFEELYNNIENCKSPCHHCFYTYQTLFRKRKRIELISSMKLTIKEEKIPTIVIKEEYQEVYKPSILDLAQELPSEDFILFLKDNQINQVILK